MAANKPQPSGSNTEDPAIVAPEAVIQAVPASSAASAALATPADAKLTSRRSLWQVGWLAMLLDDLGYLQDAVNWEAAVEADGSPVPGQLLTALQSLGQVLIDMTAEEVAELLAGTDENEDETPADIVEMASGIDLKRNAFRAMRGLDSGALVAVTTAMRLHLGGKRIAFTDGGPAVPFQRVGRVFSAASEHDLRDAHAHVRQAVDIMAALVDSAVDDPGSDPTEDAARALRQRKARALRLAAARPSSAA